MKDWLEPAVKQYLAYFSKTRRPYVGFASGKTDDLIRAARRIYDDDDQWFRTDLKLFRLPHDEVPALDMLLISTEDLKTISVPKKTKMLITDDAGEYDFIFNLGYQSVHRDDSCQIWIIRQSPRG